MGSKAEKFFFVLVCASLLTPFLVFESLLYPYVTSKAFYFRIVIEFAFPLYLFLLLRTPSLRPNMKSPLVLGILGFATISLISAFFGVNTLRSMFGNFERMGGVFYFLHLIALVFYVQLLGKISSRYVELILKLCIWVSVLTCLNGISGWLGGPTLVADDSLLTPPYRVSSTFGNPIFFASFLIVPMFLSAYFAIKAQTKGWRFLYSFMAAVQLLALYTSGTRGAFIGLIIGGWVSVCVSLVLTKNRKARLYGSILGGVVAVFLVFLFLFSTKLPQAAQLRRLFSLQDQNTRARLIQWKSAWQGFGDRPVLGTGPENYYVIGNQYYNSESYNFDRGWYDKPHNYLLEILVTTGVFGFFAYLWVVWYCAKALLQAFRAGILSFGEVSVLLGCLVAYEVQNLFIFDTVSANITFFLFLGFSQSLWSQVKSKEDKGKLIVRKGIDPIFLKTAVFLTCVGFSYLIYAANAMPLVITRKINYAIGYKMLQPSLALDYFKQARNLPFNFDPEELSGQYVDFGIWLLKNSFAFEEGKAQSAFDEALKVELQSVQTVSNDPKSWQRVAKAYIISAFYNKTKLDPHAEQALAHAESLAPNRIEPKLIRVEVLLGQYNLPAAEKLLTELVGRYPKNTEAKVQLANLYYYLGHKDEAVALAEQALKLYYMPTDENDLLWLGQYYSETGKDAEAIRIFELISPYQPNNEQLHWELAKVYAKTGQTDKAVWIAEKIIQVDPVRKQEMQDFIASVRPKEGSKNTNLLK